MDFGSFSVDDQDRARDRDSSGMLFLFAFLLAVGVSIVHDEKPREKKLYVFANTIRLSSNSINVRYNYQYRTLW